MNAKQTKSLQRVSNRYAKMMPHASFNLIPTEEKGPRTMRIYCRDNYVTMVIIMSDGSVF